MPGRGSHDRAALGAADVEDAVLREMVAALLRRPAADVEVLSSSATPVAYELESITTGLRCWVRGDARIDDAVVPYSLFVKVVQSFARSPYFQFIPSERREMAEASVPWRTEPQVYRSDLHRRLPVALSMPRSLGVFDLDEASASVWIEEIRPAEQAWDLERFAAAAHALGRLAASPSVAELAGVGGHDWTVHDYLHARLELQVLPMLRDDAIWRHPAVTGAFDARLRRRLVGAADRTAAYVDELTSLPTATGHGDACPNNLLAPPHGGPGFVLIDYGFWGVRPIGFDLGQLLAGDVQVGRRPASTLAATEDAIVPAYIAGLRAEGNAVPDDVVRRAHALQLLIFTGLSALPFDLVDVGPSDALQAVAADRAALATFSLDLVDATAAG